MRPVVSGKVPVSDLVTYTIRQQVTGSRVTAPGWTDTIYIEVQATEDFNTDRAAADWVYDTMQSLFNMFGYSLNPMTLTFDGHEITVTDTQEADDIHNLILEAQIN